VRLPFFYGLGQADMDRVCRTMSQFFGV